MEVVHMVKDGNARIQSRENMGFYYFIEMPLYSTINELRKACLYQRTRLEAMRQDPKLMMSPEQYTLLNKKLLKTCEVLTDNNKREKYLHLLKIRTYVNQVTNQDKIQSFQHGRVFPWMLFKIMIEKVLYTMEIDLLAGAIKVLSTVDAKIKLHVQKYQVNGCYDMFDSDMLTLSYLDNQGPGEFKFEPFYASHKTTLMSYIELFVESDKLYLHYRKEIQWPEPGKPQIEIGPKKKTADLSQHDGFIHFDDDRIVPSLSGFKEDNVILTGKDLNITIIIGPKQILISKNPDVTDIINVFVITQKSPKISVEEDKVIITEENSPVIALKFDNPAKGPSMRKSILEYQQTNFQFQYEVNSFPTIRFPGDYEQAIKDMIEMLHKKEKDGNENEGSDEGSEFDGYDFDYD